ncbi:MAG: bis(5'-nucleosyl)-tetraphosphatase (symmetrical) YqeK [bacterium]|nr:bis(5'-nucleosyl)-tetraphosphatase (symmetrical) YqeK [bacterium]
MTEWIATCRRVREEIGQEARYRHSIGVARTAERLAMAHGAKAVSARTAGVLHDLARLWSKERLLDEARRRGIALDAFDVAHPVVIHAPLSAALAAERFGVRDAEVLDAIRKHTLGAAGMSRLDEVLFLADALEPGRRYDGRAAMLDLALQDLRGGMRAVLKSTLRHHADRNLTISPRTLACARAYGVAIPKELLHA